MMSWWVGSYRAGLDVRVEVTLGGHTSQHCQISNRRHHYSNKILNTKNYTCEHLQFPKIQEDKMAAAACTCKSESSVK